MSLPTGRTADYAIWRSCERLKLLPPNVKFEWDKNNVWMQSYLIAYDQVRRYEEDEDRHQLYKMLGASVGAKRARG